MLYYEHEMISESLLLGVFIATVAVAVPPGSLMNNRRLIYFCLLALLIVAVKPAGRRSGWGSSGGGTHYPAAILLAESLLRHLSGGGAHRIHLGGDSQGPWLFLSSTLPLVKTEGEPYAAERALLRPAIEAARTDLPNYAFTQGIYKKMLSSKRADGPLGPEYAKLLADHKRFARWRSPWRARRRSNIPFYTCAWSG